MRDHWQYMLARLLPMGISIAVMPLCARLYPSEAWTALATSVASVGLMGAIGASMRPLTVRYLSQPDKVDRLMNGKIGFALVAGCMGGALNLTTADGAWPISALTAVLAALTFLAGDAELILVARSSPRRFMARLFCVSGLGNGLQLLLGWVSPTANSLVASTITKSAVGTLALYHCVDLSRIGRDMIDFVHDTQAHKSSIGAAGLTSISRASMYWLQIVVLAHVGLGPLISVLYLAGRYLEPLATTLTSGLTDLTTRRLGQHNETIPTRALLALTWKPRLVSSILVASAAMILAAVPAVFLGMEAQNARQPALAIGAICVARVLVSPNAWLPHALNQTRALWIGETARLLLFATWAVLVATTGAYEIALWGLVAFEVASYGVFQMLIRRMAPARVETH